MLAELDAVFNPSLRITARINGIPESDNICAVLSFGSLLNTLYVCTHKLWRLSVKHQRTNKYGCVDVSTKTVYSNRRGNHSSYVDKNWIDGFAVYCPEKQTCYYIRTDELGPKNTFCVRVNMPVTKSGLTQIWKSNLAENYTDANRLWMAEGAGIEPAHGMVTVARA